MLTQLLPLSPRFADGVQGLKIGLGTVGRPEIPGGTCQPLAEGSRAFPEGRPRTIAVRTHKRRSRGWSYRLSQLHSCRCLA